MLPLGHVSFFRLGSHLTFTWRLRATLMIPLTPSTITLRASSILAATKAILIPRLAANWLTHSAPARVLPNPRPAIISHTRQPSPSGMC